jgi:hypothetical protein
MDGSRLIAWGIGLVAVALGIAVIAGESTFVEDLTRLAVDLPSVPTHLGALVGETKQIGWGLLSFATLLVLLWSKLR